MSIAACVALVTFFSVVFFCLGMLCFWLMDGPAE